MNKKLREMLVAIDNKRTEARNLLESGDIEGAKKLKNEVENMKTEYGLALELYEDETNAAIENSKVIEPKNKKTKTGEFLNVLRGKAFDNTMVSRDNEAGGYTVPEDIQTQINRFLEAQDSLRPFIRASQVSTESGSRVFQKRCSEYITGFQVVEELAEIGQEQTPQFSQLKYRVLKYAGWFLASNEVLADTDANLSATLVEWIGNMLRVTTNKKIIELLNTKVADVIETPDDIKKAMHVTLDPAFRSNTTIITNQDGFHYLSTLKYEDGRNMLQETMAFSVPFQFAGRPLVVLSNNDLPSTGEQAPIYIGDLNEAVWLFDRMALTIRRSDEAGKAWRYDATEWRAISRFDIVMRDEQAFVRGNLPIGGTPASGVPVKKSK